MAAPRSALLTLALLALLAPLACTAEDDASSDPCCPETGCVHMYACSEHWVPESTWPAVDAEIGAPSVAGALDVELDDAGVVAAPGDDARFLLVATERNELTVFETIAEAAPGDAGEDAADGLDGEAEAADASVGDAGTSAELRHLRRVWIAWSEPQIQGIHSLQTLAPRGLSCASSAGELRLDGGRPMCVTARGRVTEPTSIFVAGTLRFAAEREADDGVKRHEASLDFVGGVRGRVTIAWSTRDYGARHEAGHCASY